MKYVYEALDAKGGEAFGKIDADSQSEAISHIRNKGLFPIKVVSEKTADKLSEQINIVFKKRKSVLSLARPLTTLEKAMMSIISFLVILNFALIMKIINT